MTRVLTGGERQHVLDVLREALIEVVDSEGCTGTPAAAGKRAALTRAYDKLSRPVKLTPGEVSAVFAAQARLEVEWGPEGDDTPQTRRTWRAFEAATAKVLEALR